VQEFKLPDVYMCLPSTVVAKFTLKDKKHDKEWNGCQSRKVVCGNGWEDLEASTDPPPPDNYITGDLSGCPALIEMFGCEHPDYTEWAGQLSNNVQPKNELQGGGGGAAHCRKGLPVQDAR